MNNCPTRYFDNCRCNQLCPSCSVHGGEILLYTAIEDIGVHPASEPTEPVDPKALARRKKQGKRAQKQGHEAERNIFTRLGGVHNPTSIGYDGIVMGYRVEYKVRLKKGGPNVPTRAEWDKAREQGNKLVIVEDKTTGEITVTMSIETFEAIRHEEDHNWAGDGVSKHGP